MEMEKARGISITSTAMQFEYQGFMINLLDTPGHADFSEDTYRTLAAADNALMLIDAAKVGPVVLARAFHTRVLSTARPRGAGPPRRASARTTGSTE